MPKLQEALTDDLYRRALIPQLVFGPFLLMLYLVLDDAVRARPLIGWVFVALSIVMVLRVVIIRSENRLRQRYVDPRVRLWVFTLGATMTGVGLGLINLLSAPVISAEQVALLACAAAGFNSISIVSMNSNLRTYFMSMLPNFGTIPILLMIGPALQHRSIFLISVLVNLLALVLMAVHLHRQTRKTMLLRLNVDDMNTSLSTANAALKSEIGERLAAEQSLAERNAQLQASNERLADTRSQLVQSEKMASIGQLAAGIAHEINNPIAFVRANLQSLDRYVPEMLSLLDTAGDRPAGLPRSAGAAQAAVQAVDVAFLREDIPALLTESIEGATRIENIVRDLKNFSHLDQADREKVDLHKGIDTTLNVAAHELKYRIEVIRDYGKLPMVECLPFQINQVFLNLLLNAAQAIEGRGTIRISSGCDDDSVWIRIADTGKGIAPAHLNRIFEPFFTTKPVGIGTGLGLSISYSIVRRHGGNIEVSSEVDKGTTFTVHLPIAARLSG